MKNEELIIIRSDENDKQEISDLLKGAVGDGLTAEQRAKNGFVQGAMDDELLTKFQQGLGVYIVKVNDKTIAAAFTSKIGITAKGPIVEAAQSILNKFKDLTSDDIFQYGPVVVSPDYKGKGVLTQMLLFLCATMGKDFKKGMAFVEEANQLSLDIHHHYFGEEETTFIYNERKYYVFLFDPQFLLQKYKKLP